MKTATGTLLALLALPPSAPAAAAPAEPPSAIRIELPGRLSSATVLPIPGDEGRASLALVVEEIATAEEPGEAGPPDPVRRLYRYDLASRTFAPWSGMDGEPLAAGSPRLAARLPDDPWLGTVRFGSLDVAPLSREEGTAAPRFRHDLPRRASRHSWGLRLTSPAAWPLAPVGTPDAPPCFATEPEALGPRLRVLLLCPGAERDRAPEETWALLPRDETVTETRFGLLDGAPALAVLTRTELGLFAKQDLRVFALSGSRNRLGAGPILAQPTDCPLWRKLDLAFADADGDGHQDVVLACEKGLVDPELRLELHRWRASGGAAGAGGAFEPPRVIEIEGRFDTWSYQGDWTGDGLADLVTLNDDRIELRPGTTGRRPVARDAAWTVALPPREDASEDEARTEVRIGGTDGADVGRWTGGPAILAASDLDGDGRAELVVHRPSNDGDELLILRR